ncbi:MAG: methionine adenosyltransferase [Candidatus Methanomethylicota archaeon]|nr:methionine adenosyltransferase [Candidatus Culexmicrobium cathedralense]RLE48238.1 MAG: methionine adenosyltransferase [Candidatus Verstraetearchaeota archaeon]
MDKKGRINIELLCQKPVEELNTEIVERKGLGHPDYIADASAESVSLALSQYYLKEFGTILHHNVDKGLVVGGRASPSFGGGYVEEPIYVIIAGRAANEVIKEKEITRIPVGCIAVNAIRQFIKENFRFLDPDEHMIIDYKIRPGSVDLVSIFQFGRKMPLANDTSFGVCFAPLTQTERLVLETEKYLNSKELKKELPEVGEDIKVMGLRRDKEIELTIAAAMISKLIPDLDHYMSVKEEVKRRIEDLAAKITDYPVNVKVNAADKPDKGIIYITVTGTSAESGDDGNTGRGNRVNGLITPCRPMSMEATAGKNPVSHVGKIYNVMAKILANKIYEEVNGIKEVYVKILGQIGRPIDDPLHVDVQMILQPGYSLSSVRGDVEGIVDEEMANVTKITELVLQRKVEIF